MAGQRVQDHYALSGSGTVIAARLIAATLMRQRVRVFMAFSPAPITEP